MQVSALVGSQLNARRLLEAATWGSARGVGRPELGTLEFGSVGDLAVWDISGVADAGVSDPVAGLLWTIPDGAPGHVVVNGNVVVKDYRLVWADEAMIVADLTRLLGRGGAMPR